MVANANDNQLHTQFDWIGLIALLIGFDGSIRLLADTNFNGLLLQILILGCLLILIICIRHYNWKNILVALLLIGTIHPMRFIFQWWINPIIFGVTLLICLIFMARIIRNYTWKNRLTALLLVCSLTSGWQMVTSAAEINHCYIDDMRWTHFFYCEPTNGQYQQIESLPIGMQGYCYYCPWYVGVRRW